MRGAPQVELSVTMRKMRSRSSLLTHFLPALARCRESHVQYNLKPARCQRMTVSGWTRISTCLHLGQSRRKITQNNLSEVANRGFGCLRSKTPSCCRSARFSNRRSRCEQMHRLKRTTKRLGDGTIGVSNAEAHDTVGGFQKCTGKVNSQTLHVPREVGFVPTMCPGKNVSDESLQQRLRRWSRTVTGVPVIVFLRPSPVIDEEAIMELCSV